MPKPRIGCQTCGSGRLLRKKRYRMSGPVVLIGYILLIPSVLGILFCILMLFASGGAATETFGQIEQETRQELGQAGIPQDVIESVIEVEPLTQTQHASLSSEQLQTVNDAKLSLSAGKAGAGLGTAFAGGASICLGISFFVGGLLGWLLIMKKRVLQCNSCGAVVAAS